MKKTVLILSSVVLGLGVLTGCDVPENEPAAPVETTTSPVPVPSASEVPVPVPSASASPSVSVSVSPSASPVESTKNDEKGDGGV